jgi:hypothetical protein
MWNVLMARWLGGHLMGLWLSEAVAVLLNVSLLCALLTFGLCAMTAAFMILCGKMVAP